MTDPSGEDVFPDVTVPDDLSGLDDATAAPDAPRPVAVVVTQVGAAEPLAAACALAGLEVDAVLSGIGVFVVCRDTSPGAPQRVAETLTRAMSGLPAILLERRDDRITAHRWLDGVQGDKLAPAIVLGGAPDALENLLLGVETVDELPGVVSSVGMGRFAAMRALASTARAAKRSAKKKGKAS
ncbi:hypothetical protein [Luteimicrobium subarcticum]|uniref:Uncharacterized protein n=1 Tax=Luteimicrobium subarcticum TaxID=620910 RepID=A0A2M8WTX6_9MICO|nr:hypothetical protein [Luteimicrobium subarcticum]PJI94316.1 hypothetical protein CLV34_0152 [Luteimicrobium subarcticum]